MAAVLQRIASVANGLGKAELRVLIELAARAEVTGTLQTNASSRDLAHITGLARGSVQAAIDSLSSKNLIRSGGGNNTQSAVYHLVCLSTDQDKTASRIVWEPGVAQVLGQGGSVVEPGVAQVLGQGPNFEPTFDEKSSAYQNSQAILAYGRADSIDFDLDRTIDRLQKARKCDFDEALFELARTQIASHHTKFARAENQFAGLPDDAITAQFLAIAPWPDLEAMLFDLTSERKEAGHSYGWYVTVALQRICGISPNRLRDVRLRLKDPANPSSGIARAERSQCSALPRAGEFTPHVSTAQKTPAVRRSPNIEQLKQQIRTLATARAM